MSDEAISIESPSLLIPLKTSQYEAYNLPNAEASDQLLLVAEFAEDETFKKFLLNDVAALPLEAPVRLKFASALVISIRF